MSFKLPDLPYAYDALEPHFDEQTMRIHHDKHHAGYTKKLNNAIEDTNLENMTIEQILGEVSKHPAAVRNNAGGYYNHTLFWNILTPGGKAIGDRETSKLHKAIIRSFGDFEGFRKEFMKAATGRFGSGWAWLCVSDPVGELYICSTPNQDNPLMDVNKFTGRPILGVDVWEHAYYLKYQNRRADYLEAFFELINWEVVERWYTSARTQAALV